MTQPTQPTSPLQSDPDRRGFLGGALGTLFGYSLLGALSSCDAFPREVGPNAKAWLAGMQDLAASVKGQSITQVEWQARADELFEQIQLEEFLALIDFEDLVRRCKFTVRQANVTPKLPRVAGIPRETDYGKIFFGLKRGQAIPPHGHYNMATGFVVLGGEFHARHFDRVEEHDDHMLLRPTIDATFTVGDHSTISDFKDNVHWFVTESDVGYLFNVHVHHIDPAIDLHGRAHVDPTGTPDGDGLIRAPKLTSEQSFQRFGDSSSRA